MEAFSMEIAGVVVRVQPLFQSTREYFRSYLTEQNSDFFMQVRKENLIVEQGILEQEAVEQGLKIRKFQDPFLERSFIQRCIADYLAGQNTLMLHGSTVSVDGRAYLFTAPCGTGKSTHTRLWREQFGDRAIMVNDDKAFLRITSDCVLAYGSPWSGKHGLDSNICVPLKGICLLRRGLENRIHRAAPDSLREILYHEVHTPVDEALTQKLYALVDTIAESVPLWIMSCNKEPEAATVAYFAMSRDSI